MVICLLIVVVSITIYSLYGSKYQLAGLSIDPPVLFAKSKLTRPYAKQINDTITSQSKVVTEQLPTPPLAKINLYKKPIIIDTSQGQRILMIGESMIEGLYLSLRPIAFYHHHKLKAQIWYGSTSIEWSKNDTLRKVLLWFKPSLVMVSIGANELSVRDISKREANIVNIIKQLQGYRYIWIGPPNWKKDSGIGDVLEGNIPENQYFRSRDLKYKRRRDGAHPTLASAHVWADTLSNWIMMKSAYPINLIKKPMAVKDTTTKNLKP